MPLGVEKLEELVVELIAEHLPHPLLERAGAGVHDGRIGALDGLRDREERGVEVLEEAGTQQRIRQAAHDQENGEQGQRVPDGETATNRQRAHQSAALSTYPAPRIVRSRGRSPSASILRRT